MSDLTCPGDCYAKIKVLFKLLNSGGLKQGQFWIRTIFGEHLAKEDGALYKEGEGGEGSPFIRIKKK